MNDEAQASDATNRQWRGPNVNDPLPRRLARNVAPQGGQPAHGDLDPNYIENISTLIDSQNQIKMLQEQNRTFADIIRGFYSQDQHSDRKEQNSYASSTREREMQRRHEGDRAGRAGKGHEEG